ncbi:histidine phosphotransferase family protein [Roseivivax sediminis]|uniref:Histidine phosphotransferase ChpT n=1 Tax=Roseivivax sediminis TaxID=936889 RepID=A0A1I1YW82_9RHOB|nr:histidine phosphotransferase family protein [Roseivivax sediminis]SFE23572.1 histidine phosphotransferase ChpT [Roseivivax sediminis]
MSESNADLAQLIGSRICHDLISPVGAINNGVELLSMTAGMPPDPEEMSLIETSARAAAARIKLFRIAFGAAGTEEAVRRSEMRAILTDVTADKRLDVDLSLDGDPPRTEAQLGLLALLCVDAALTHGGLVQASWQSGRWHLTTEAEPRKYAPGLWSILTDGAAEDVTPAEVQFRLLADRAAEMGRAITVEDGETALTLTV